MGLVKISCFFFCVFISLQADAQTKTTDTLSSLEHTSSRGFQHPGFPDSIFKFNTPYPVPKRAALYSAIFPGIGQVYNKQYWKLGVVGAGLGIATYFIVSNNKKYKTYQTAYLYRIDNNPETIDDYVQVYSANDLYELQKTYRSYLEYSVIFTTVGYALNILDAFVSANLKSFDVTSDISFRPGLRFENQQIGLALKLHYK